MMRTMAGGKASEERIRERILEAIFGGRLAPGVRLTEEALAELFGVSRTVVRQALARLAQDGIVLHRRNRGTVVTAPTRTEARQTLIVRQMVEPDMVALLAREPDPAALRRLKHHIDAEAAARTAGDHARLLRLTGNFHMMLAHATKNPILIRLLTELLALSCLSVVLYARATEDACPPIEHCAIVDAIVRGEPDTAAALMRRHLDHVEAGMDLDQRAANPVTLADALGGRSSDALIRIN